MAAVGTAQPLAADTRMLVQGLVAKPEQSGKPARVLSYNEVCGAAGRREGAVIQGRVRGEQVIQRNNLLRGGLCSGRMRVGVVCQWSLPV